MSGAVIRRCFTVFPGIGPGRERALRAAGIADWQQLLSAGAVPGLSERLGRSVRREARQWAGALAEGDAGFFVRNLPRAEHWMLFEAFGDSVRYLDIETTGLSARRHAVTVVGISDGRRYQALVNGRGLSERSLGEALRGCKLLVTYFGTAFDVPFLRHHFPGIEWGVPHFDLCFGARRVGLTGGLKGVERKLGLVRDDAIAEVDGFEAVRLWRAHQRGDPAALETLLAYNEADTCNLARIASVVHQRLCRRQMA